jgi:hypothetical protein
MSEGSLAIDMPIMSIVSRVQVDTCKIMLSLRFNRGIQIRGQDFRFINVTGLQLRSSKYYTGFNPSSPSLLTSLLPGFSSAIRPGYPYTHP